MKEHCHFVALLPLMLRLACSSEIPVAGRSHDSFWLARAVIAANCHTIGGWVTTLFTACLTLGFAAFCFA
jgi:hypothetical protein